MYMKLLAQTAGARAAGARGRRSRSSVPGCGPTANARPPARRHTGLQRYNSYRHKPAAAAALAGDTTIVGTGLHARVARCH